MLALQASMRTLVQVPNHPGAVVYVYNPSTGKQKTRGFLGIASNLDESTSSRFSETNNRRLLGIVIDTFNPSILEGRARWISVNSSLARGCKVRKFTQPPPPKKREERKRTVEDNTQTHIHLKNKLKSIPNLRY